MKEQILKRAKDEIINKVLEAFDSVSKEEFMKLVVNAAIAERQQILRKLLGLPDGDKDFSNQANSRNQRTPLHNSITQEMQEVYDKEIQPEIAKMIQAERENILKAIKAEFIDSGYMMHKARSYVLEQADDWITEATKSVFTDIKKNILKEAYEDLEATNDEAKAR